MRRWIGVPDVGGACFHSPYCTVLYQPACRSMIVLFSRGEKAQPKPWWTWKRGVVGRSSRWLELGLCRSLDLTWQAGSNIRSYEVLYCTEEERSDWISAASRWLGLGPVLFDAAIRYDHPLFIEAVKCRPVNHALRAATAVQ